MMKEVLIDFSGRFLSGVAGVFLAVLIVIVLNTYYFDLPVKPNFFEISNLVLILLATLLSYIKK